MDRPFRHPLRDDRLAQAAPGSEPLWRRSIDSGGSAQSFTHAGEKPSARRSTIDTASSILKSLPGDSDAAVSLGRVFDAMGPRAHGIGILLFALPETIPMPLITASTVLAVPIVLLAAHLMIFGEGRGMPRRVEQAHFPKKLLDFTLRYAVPVLERLERVSRPRLAWIAHRHRLIGAFCLVLSVVLALPIPLANTLPAICLVLLGLGMITDDGLFVLLGVVLALAGGLALYLFAGSLAGLVQ